MNGPIPDTGRGPCALSSNTSTRSLPEPTFCRARAVGAAPLTAGAAGVPKPGTHHECELTAADGPSTAVTSPNWGTGLDPARATARPTTTPAPPLAVTTTL